MGSLLLLLLERQPLGGGTLANFFGVLGRRGNPMNDTERKKSTIKKIKIIHSIRASS